MMSVMREAMTRQQRYAREIDRLLAQVDRLDAQAVRRSIRLLTAARRRIVARLAELPGDTFEAYYLQQMQGELKAQMARYARDYGRYLDDETRRWWDLGRTFVDEPIIRAGGAELIASLPSLDPRMVDLLQGYRASLITGISTQATTQITTALQLGVLGGKSPFDVSREVADILSTQPNPQGAFRGIAARAEAITRTELNRTFSLAAQSRQAQAQARAESVFPELVLRKRWLNAGDDRVRPAHRRPELVAQRPAVNEDFVLRDTDGSTYRAAGPHDARLPASLSTNCRCRSITDLDSIMSVLEGV